MIKNQWMQIHNLKKAINQKFNHFVGKEVSQNEYIAIYKSFMKLLIEYGLDTHNTKWYIGCTVKCKTYKLNSIGINI